MILSRDVYTNRNKSKNLILQTMSRMKFITACRLYVMLQELITQIEYISIFVCMGQKYHLTIITYAIITVVC